MECPENNLKIYLVNKYMFFFNSEKAFHLKNLSNEQ